MTSLSETQTVETAASRQQRGAAGFCPNCQSAQLTTFYSVESVPAHSCLLMDSKEEAVGYPRGRLDLAYCEDCGFITNLSYETGLKDYSSRYEETQHFSGCFNRFAKRLAERWVREYNLHSKTILEIGCGKGEFLELLCSLGECQGIGFDPGVNPGRLSEEANSRLRFVKDYYSEKYRDEKADAICCRHTLEHIPDTDAFLADIRKNVEGQDDVLLLFELPDTTRVLRELAFWDLYYEHCSYFTAGSLARLFRRNRFDLLELCRDYDDQYLLIVGSPSNGEPRPDFELEDDLESTAADVALFKANQERAISDWQERLRNYASEGKRTVLWGGGSKGVGFLTTLGVDAEVDAVVDINPYKHGKFMPGSGHQVVGPETLRERKPDVVILMNPIYHDEVAQQLSELGLSPELINVTDQR